MNARPPIFSVVRLLFFPWTSWQAVQKAWGYSSYVYTCDDTRRRFKKNVRWALLAAFRPGFFLEWLRWAESSDMLPFLKANPIFALKPLRVYVSVKWNIKRRYKVLHDTYDTVLHQGGALRRALLNPEGVILAELDLPRLGRIEIGMCKDFGFWKEGEFVIFLRNRELGGWYIALTFGLEKFDNSALTCYIGNLQGRSGSEEVREITKAMHGLRPRYLMVFVVREIAGSLGASKLLGTGNAIHVYRRKHLVHLPFRHAIPFDYDAFWVESGAEIDSEGWFRLPLRFNPRSLDDIKPNKRSMYAKRYEMLDELSEQIRNAMNQGHSISTNWLK